MVTDQGQDGTLPLPRSVSGADRVPGHRSWPSPAYSGGWPAGSDKENHWRSPERSAHRRSCCAPRCRNGRGWKIRHSSVRLPAMPAGHVRRRRSGEPAPHARKSLCQPRRYNVHPAPPERDPAARQRLGLHRVAGPSTRSSGRAVDFYGPNNPVPSGPQLRSRSPNEEVGATGLRYSLPVLVARRRTSGSTRRRKIRIDGQQEPL